MTSEFETIFSRVFGRIDDIKLASLGDRERDEIMTEWLHGVISKPRVRRKFNTLTIDDDSEIVTYELIHSVDEDSDREFVEDLLVLGMEIEWLEPKVNSVVYTAPMIGTSDEKKVLDSHRQNIHRLESMKTELKKNLRDYGYMYNSYLGDS